MSEQEKRILVEFQLKEIITTNGIHATTRKVFQWAGVLDRTQANLIIEVLNEHL